MDDNNKNGRKFSDFFVKAGIDAVKGALNPKYLLIKILVIIIVFILLFLLVISCLFQIIFSDLGFLDADDYSTTMYSAETENIRNTLDSYFGESDNFSYISGLFLSYDGSRFSLYDTSHELPTGGVLKEYYDAIEDDYISVYEANTALDEDTGEREPVVDENGTENIYVGYTVSSGYDGFWSDNNYMDYFLPAIQNSSTKLAINAIENGNTGILENNLERIILNNSWATWVRTEDTVEVESSEEVSSRKYYSYCGPADKTFRFLNKNKKYYLDEMEQLEGVNGKTEQEWEEAFLRHKEDGDGVIEDGEWWKLCTETITTENTVNYITCNYSIELVSPGTSTAPTQNKTYSFVDDEDKMDKAVRLLRYVIGDPEEEDKGIFGFFRLSLANLMSWTSSEIRSNLTSSDYSIINRIVSWRDVVGTSATMSSGASFIGDYSLGANAAQNAMANHINDIYSQHDRMVTGYSDCSSLVAKSYNEAGFSELLLGGSAMTAAEEAKYCEENGTVLSGPSELMPGDLIFYYKATAAAGGRYKGIGHVAMYVGDVTGDDQPDIIEAKGVATNVVINTFKEDNSTVLYARPYVAVSGAESENDAYQLLTQSCGFTKAGACGILANIYCESSFDPSVEYSGHRGICQWDRGRWENLQAYCASNGLDCNSFSGQFNFMIYELNSYPELVSFLKTTDDPEMAAQEFCVGFERAIISSERASAKDLQYTGSLYPKRYGSHYQNLAGRIYMANQYYNTY